MKNENGKPSRETKKQDVAGDVRRAMSLNMAEYIAEQRKLKEDTGEIWDNQASQRRAPR